MDDDGVIQADAEKGLEGRYQALEEAEAARLRLEAELVARSLAEREAIRRLPGASQDFA